MSGKRLQKHGCRRCRVLFLSRHAHCPRCGGTAVSPRRVHGRFIGKVA